MRARRLTEELLKKMTRHLQGLMNGESTSVLAPGRRVYDGKPVTKKNF
jgi:hypothetical protein